MKTSIKHIIDSHKDKTAIVLANGPSTKFYLEFIKKCSLNKDKYVIFVCNEVDKMLENINMDLINDINPDFWVVANSVQTVKNYYDRFNKLSKNKGTLVYADSVDLSVDVDKLLNINYIQYDQRHFNGKICPEGFRECCKKCLVENQAKTTIQEELKNFTGYFKHYGTGSTVAVHMLSLAILTGCKKIYMSGIDLNYNLGYFDEKTINNDSFEPWLGEIIEDFKIINQSALLKDIEIINLSKNSYIKNVFKTEEINDW